jgi:hypothetical protein
VRNNGLSRPFPPGRYHCESLFFMDRGENRVVEGLAVAYLDRIYWLHDEPKTGWSLPTGLGERVSWH